MRPSARSCDRGEVRAVAVAQFGERGERQALGLAGTAVDHRQVAHFPAVGELGVAVAEPDDRRYRDAARRRPAPGGTSRSSRRAARDHRSGTAGRVAIDLAGCAGKRSTRIDPLAHRQVEHERAAHGPERHLEVVLALDRRDVEIRSARRAARPGSAQSLPPRAISVAMPASRPTSHQCSDEAHREHLTHSRRG